MLYMLPIAINQITKSYEEEVIKRSKEIIYFSKDILFYRELKEFRKNQHVRVN